MTDDVTEDPVSRKRAQVAAGDVVAARELRSIHGEAVAIPDPRRLVHLQFRRFAGCPICTTHLRSVGTRHAARRDRGGRDS